MPTDAHTLAALIAREIRHLDRGAPLPSIADTCDTYGVTANVARKAFKYLIQAGLVEAVHGAGHYVADPTVDYPAADQPADVAVRLAELERRVADLERRLGEHE